MRAFRLALMVGCIVGCGSSTSATEVADSETSDAASLDGGAGVPYGPCDQCGSLRCESFTWGGGSVHWCAPPCDPALKGADCPKAPAGSTARPMCVEHSSTVYVCALACGTASGTCPAAMKCANDNRYCGY